MPRVKIDYVVSFSSEDPEHPASNLLLREVSKKKWLCRKGESTCSVVLQLPRTVKITGVHIGAYHAALVEVLVGRSETSSEQFQAKGTERALNNFGMGPLCAVFLNGLAPAVRNIHKKISGRPTTAEAILVVTEELIVFKVLVPSSVFISREESKRDEPVLRVRSFGTDALSSPARDQRWDRVRLVCSQPHNKHCQFGLSFVHIDEAEGTASGAVPPRLLALDTFSSDEDEFKPGELFAKHLQNSSGELPSSASSNTGAQIRHATSQALKNIPESSTKLVKTPISKPSAARAQSPSERRSARGREALLYCRADAQPHAHIDSVLSRHQLDKQNEATTKRDSAHQLDKTNQKTKENSKTKAESNMKNKSKDENKPPQRKKDECSPTPRGSDDKPTGSQVNKDKEVRKRRHSSSQEPVSQELQAGPVSEKPHELLRGAVLVLSGYQHPRRAAVRATAAALGARVQPDWGPGATHLICAFPNTPKLRAVRAAAGDSVPVARAEWLDHMARRRRALPWRWYATEPRLRVAPPPETPPPDTPSPPPDTPHAHDSDPDDDTDEEIEKVLEAQKKRRLNESNTNDDRRECDDMPAASTSVSCDTEDEVVTDEEARGSPARGGALPDFFDGLTFAVDAAPAQAQRMARYVLAYGGLVLTMADVEEGSEVDYIVHGHPHASHASHAPHVSHATHVSAAWLADCHRARALLPHT